MHPLSMLLFFPLAKYYSAFINWALSLSLPRNLISNKTIIFLCLPCYSELLVLAVHWSKKSKNKNAFISTNIGHLIGVWCGKSYFTTTNGDANITWTFDKIISHWVKISFKSWLLKLQSRSYDHIILLFFLSKYLGLH